MSKKIVVFGPDNSGKTTLSTNICDLLPWYVKSHSLGPVSVERMLKYILENLDSDSDFVFDRFPIIEEMTCGYVLRGHNKFQGMNKVVIDCLSRVDLFIYCDPGMDVIENWGGREQMAGVKENITRLKEAYDQVWALLVDMGYNVIKYDWKMGQAELDKIIERINKI